ncbi:uncharacterized protein JCM15063_006462 [Sporobolomyces koalae]|uniref:uncharacterized protein n=1 Tax=Sporobolomyces koalae TaxID=500713 RepID=UPI003176D4BA
MLSPISLPVLLAASIATLTVVSAQQGTGSIESLQEPDRAAFLSATSNSNIVSTEHGQIEVTDTRIRRVKTTKKHSDAPLAEHLTVTESLAAKGGMQKKLRRTTRAHDSLHLHRHHTSKRGSSGGTFKGVSSYYLFALDDGPRRSVLDAIKAGGFSVVRIFLSGVQGNCKGSGNNPVPDLEPNQVGTYDDTILYKIDQLMADCSKRGLKLVIALSDRYALGFWSTNSYAVQLNIIQPAQKGSQSLKIKNAQAFYNDPWAIKMYEQRISHVLNHQNQLMGGQKWKDLSSVVYAFEAQNEPQGYMPNPNPSWVCDRSGYISSLVGGSGIQVSSGGGIDVSTSLQGWATNCGAIDIVSVHDYGTNGYATAQALSNAQNNHPSKTIMMGEWGLTGPNKAAKISEFVAAFGAKGIPWMYWQITQPGAGASDFEVWTGEPAWGALTGGSYSYSSPSGGSSSSSSQGYNNGNSSSSSQGNSSSSAASSSPSSTWNSSIATNSTKSSAASTSSATPSTGSTVIANISVSASVSPSSVVASPSISIAAIPVPPASPLVAGQNTTATLPAASDNTSIPLSNPVVPPIDSSTIILPTESSPVVLPTSSLPAAVPTEGSVLPSPLVDPVPTPSVVGAVPPVVESLLNCNFTLVDLSNVTLHIDPHNSTYEFPSGLVCNSTILPTVSSSPLPPVDTAPVLSVSVAVEASPTPVAAVAPNVAIPAITNTPSEPINPIAATSPQAQSAQQNLSSDPSLTGNPLLLNGQAIVS